MARLGRLRQKLADEWGSVLPLMHDGEFGTLSAFKAGLSNEENLDRHKNLGEELRGLGYDPGESSGEWRGTPELTYRVEDITLEHLLMLGRKYEQEAVIHRSGPSEWMLSRL